MELLSYLTGVAREAMVACPMFCTSEIVSVAHFNAL
jgi:hypothetical protein